MPVQRYPLKGAASQEVEVSPEVGEESRPVGANQLLEVVPERVRNMASRSPHLHHRTPPLAQPLRLAEKTPPRATNLSIESK